jgi:hypothetical protein
MARKRQSKRLRKVGRSMSAPGQAVMRAFRLAKFSAPPFMSTCGIFPEVSEQASDRLHTIVNDVATRRLNKGRIVRALQRKLQRLAASASSGPRSKELVDGIGSDVTALLASEATAAYLFGLSVGMTVRTLPERLDPL